jgi:energy-converting hydrogenase Eha subunit B
MIFKNLTPKGLFRSQTLRAIACAVIVAVATVLISQVLGLPAPPGVAAALGAIAGASYLAGSRRK